VRFTWDSKKAARNLRRHGVSFEEAATVLSDPNRVELADTDNAQGDARMDVIGFSSEVRLLFVVVFEVEEDELMRVISARRATPHEAKRYAEETD
jgi:uncharacterized protein